MRTAARPWESAFVAVATLLGEPLAAVEAALGDRVSRAGETLAGVRSPERADRARAMAKVVAAVATELESIRLA
jgi:hypothetical protein